MLSRGGRLVAPGPAPALTGVRTCPLKAAGMAPHAMSNDQRLW